MKSLFFAFFTFLSLTVICQSKENTYRVSYDVIINGTQSHQLSTIFHDGIVYLSEPESKTQLYTNFNTEENISVIKYNSNYYKSVTLFADLPQPELVDSKIKVLGFKCNYAKYTYFSNSIEVWYSEKTKAKGSPYSRFLPNKNALVLKVLINGNREVVASDIEKIEWEEKREYVADLAKTVTLPEFEEIKINSRFKKQRVFANEIVNFDPSLPIPKDSVLQEDVTYRFSKGSVIMKKVRLTESKKNSEQIFANLWVKSNGDAYDRTGSVFIVPENKITSVLDAYQFGLEKLPVYLDNIGNQYQGILKDKQYDPPIEIMRFFTSFGAQYFNDKREINNYEWENNVRYKQEITSLIPNNSETFWVGVFIGNYDKGGHVVSLELDFHPAFNAEEALVKSKYIQPLFSTVNTLEMTGQNYGKLFKTDTLRVDFNIEDEIENLQLIFTTTGHGGWAGGDEFNPKQNRIFMDGTEVFSIVPWRTDCGTYRMYNPASGNFSNGTSSSDFSRSNWCPATLTPPYFIPLKFLKKGKHTVEVIIEQGEDEGTSFNHWSVTGVLTGFIKEEQ